MRTINCGLWDLALLPGLELEPPALGAQSLGHWTTRKVPAPTFGNLSDVESFSQLLRFTANKGGEVKIQTQAILVPRQLVITVPNCWVTSIYLLAAGSDPGS